MDLIVCNDGGGLACFLTAHYAGLTTRKNNAVNVSFLSKRAAEFCKKEVPLLITESNEEITESRAIMKYLAFKSAAENILCATESNNKSRVDEWLSFAAERNFLICDDPSLDVVNNYLEENTFFVDNHITLSDLAMYTSLYKYIKEKRITNSHVHICRWFDHIQNLPGIKGATNSLPLVDLHKLSDNTEIRMEESTEEKQQKKDVSKSKKTDKEEKKNIKREVDEKKEKKKEKEIIKNERQIEDITRLLVKVGVVTKVSKHPNSEKLYYEEIDIGEKEPRKIISGLVEHLKEDEFINQKILLLANMKPRNFRGLQSQGMVLCATSTDKTKCELMRPPADTPIGERIYWEGLEGEADLQMNTKSGKDPFVAVQPHFRIGSDKIGYFKDKKFMTSKGACFCDTITEGTIS